MTTLSKLKPAFLIKYGIAAFAGSTVSLMVWRIMKLEYRYGLAIVGGLIVISVCLALISRIEDVLIYALIFNIPFDRFGKWLGSYTDIWMVAPGVSLGLAEMLILMAYLVWFAQIFIARKEPLPRLQNLDYFIVLLLISQLFSLFPAKVRIIGVYDIIYNLKHILIYFFLVNKVKRRHLKWIVVILLSAIVIEASLAGYERMTGNVGIGLSKGNASDTNFANQYDVPGIEGTIRAEGTTADAHTLGLYLVMLLQVPLVLSLMSFLKPSAKVALSGILIAGAVALILTFSRAGWVAFAISTAFALWVVVFSWKRGRTLIYIAAVVIACSAAYPQGYSKIYDRFATAPSDIISTRYEMALTGLSVWGAHPLLGCGAANYMYCLYNRDVTRYEESDLPVHVMPIYIASEIGVFGLLAYYAIIFITIVRCLKLLKCDDPLIRGLALAIVAAFIAYLLDGFSSPLGREIVPYYLLWVYIALSMSFKRLLREREDDIEPAY